MDEFDFLKDPQEKEKRPMKFVAYFMNKNKAQDSQSQKIETENKKIDGSVGYSRTKVLACKPRDREI